MGRDRQLCTFMAQGVGISGGGAVEGDALHKSEPSEQF